MKINFKLPKNHVVLVYDENMPRPFGKVVIVTGVLPSTDSGTKSSVSEN